MGARVEFEWDENKNQANIRKHGIAFEDAVRVFSDPLRHSTQDRHVDGEERWKVTGIVELVGLIVLAYTWRDESEFEIVRIISARQAERRERRTYEEGDDG